LQISFYIYVEVFLWSSYSLCDLIRSDHCLFMSTGFKWDCASDVHGQKLPYGLLWWKKWHL